VHHHPSTSSLSLSPSPSSSLSSSHIVALFPSTSSTLRPDHRNPSTTIISAILYQTSAACHCAGRLTYHEGSFFPLSTQAPPSWNFRLATGHAPLSPIRPPFGASLPPMMRSARHRTPIRDYDDDLRHSSLPCDRPCDRSVRLGCAFDRYFMTLDDNLRLSPPGSSLPGQRRNITSHLVAVTYPTLLTRYALCTGSSSVYQG
jgi:hypothetical protein